MSYGDYLNKLHFGSVSDGIQAMKENAIVSQTNELDMRSLGLDSDIDKLTGKLADVQDSTDPASTIENTIGEVGGMIETGSMMKKLYGKFKELKTKAGDKVNELKGKAQDKLDEMKGKAQDKVDEANDKLSGSKDDGETKSDMPDGDNPDEFAYSSDNPGVPQPNTAQRGETDDGDVADADDDIVDGPSELNDVNFTDLPPSTTTVPDGELGSGTYTNSEPSGTGEGSIEMTELNKQPEPTGDHNPEIAQNDPQTAGRELETDMDDLDAEADDATKTLNSDTGKLEDDIRANNEADDADGDDGDIGDVGDDAAEIGADAAEDAAEVGLEATGAALDATGIGSIVGVVLGIGGLVLGAVTGSEDSATKSTDETSIQNSITADQNKINQIKQQELNIKSQIAQQHYTGANIVPNISSTTMNNVTSSSF